MKIHNYNALAKNHKIFEAIMNINFDYINLIFVSIEVEKKLNQ